jgi:hypothetical protein
MNVLWQEVSHGHLRPSVNQLKIEFKHLSKDLQKNLTVHTSMSARENYVMA